MTQSLDTFRVVVFGSSSKHTTSYFVNESIRLGEEIARRGFLCVNGAGSTGVMGGVNVGCDRQKGAVRGIIHEKFCVDFGEHPHIKDLVVCRGADLAERKQALLDNSDAVIVMPGGVGTFDEFWDCVCGKSLGMKGMNKKPICIVNLDGFYDGFLMQMRRTHKEGMLYGHVETYFHVEQDPVRALDWVHDVFSKGGAVKETESLIDNIKENNQETRVKERKVPVTAEDLVKEIKDVTVRAEEYVLDTYPDYLGLALGVGLGLLLGITLQQNQLIPSALLKLRR